MEECGEVEEGGCDGRGGSRGHAFKAFFLSFFELLLPRDKEERCRKL